jgi:hypothetical protein
MLQNTSGALKNEQSRQTGNIVCDLFKENAKNSTFFVKLYKLIFSNFQYVIFQN